MEGNGEPEYEQEEDSGPSLVRQQPDWLLTMLVAKAGLWTMNVTLVVGGECVKGTLISADEYRKEFVDLVTRESGTGSPATFRPMLESLLLLVPDTTTMYLHLRDDSGLLFRCRIASVDAFAVGQFNGAA